MLDYIIIWYDAQMLILPLPHVDTNNKMAKPPSAIKWQNRPNIPKMVKYVARPCLSK